MIPKNKWVISVHGPMGVGKTNFTSLLSGALAKKEDIDVKLICMRSKERTTLPFYEENVKKYARFKGLTWAILARYEKIYGPIIVVEDAPLFTRTTYRKNILNGLTTARARDNQTLTIVTSQFGPQSMRHVFFKAELAFKDERHFYRLIEGRNSTGWIDWTEGMDWNIDEVLEYFYNGIEGKELGQEGRPTDPESNRQKVFQLLNDIENLTPIQIIEEVDISYAVAAQYKNQWKEKTREIV